MNRRRKISDLADGFPRSSCRTSPYQAILRPFYSIYISKKNNFQICFTIKLEGEGMKALRGISKGAENNTQHEQTNKQTSIIQPYQTNNHPLVQKFFQFLIFRVRKHNGTGMRNQYLEEED
jgi:hypothetical protein